MLQLTMHNKELTKRNENSLTQRKTNNKSKINEKVNQWGNKLQKMNEKETRN